MDNGIIISGLAVIAALTGLITEAIKKMMGSKEYNSNIIAAIVSFVVSVFACVGYAILNVVVVDARFIFVCVCVCILSWLCAMLGYDKVIQTITNK